MKKKLLSSLIQVCILQLSNSKNNELIQSDNNPIFGTQINIVDFSRLSNTHYYHNPNFLNKHKSYHPIFSNQPLDIRRKILYK